MTTIQQVEVVAQPSTVRMRVRVDPRLLPLTPRMAAEIGEAVDFFVYENCGCGFDVEDHVVTPGPFGNPFLYCEKGEDS